MPRSRIIHIVDDDDGARMSLRLVLERAGYSCRTYESAEAALQGRFAHRDCALVDIRLPGMSGLELLERLINQKNIAVVITTGYADVRTAVRAMKMGAVDFLEKPFSEPALMEAVARASVEPISLQRMMQNARAASERIAVLTQREQEIFVLVSSGATNARIGTRLGISARTVEHHRRKIMSKCGTKTLADLLRLAISAGISAR